MKSVGCSFQLVKLIKYFKRVSEGTLCKEQVNKCMKTTFGAIKQPHIKTTSAKKETRVLALLMFYETRQNPRKAFKVLSCVIYTIISNYVCIDDLACDFV